MTDIVQQLQGVWDTLAELPLVVILLVLLPLVLLAMWGKIYPHVTMLIAVSVPLVLCLLLLLRRDVLPWVLATDLAVVLFALFDLSTLPRRRDLIVERHCQKTASLNKDHPVRLVLSNRGRRRYLVHLRDDLSEQMEGDPDQLSCWIEPNRRVTFAYDLRCRQRGAQQLSRVHLQIRSRYGFWCKCLALEVSSDINVYPDMQQLSKYAVLARTNRLSMMGVRRTRKIGHDNEFERLRDYTIDDNYRHIEWRSTARRGRLTVRDFQSNQSQRLIFLVDCGRMMTNQAAGLTLLDHALNAMLMLSFVALRQGDAVGTLCFSDRVHSYVPPRSGMQQMNRLLHASYDQFPGLVESRYGEAFLHLSTHCHKRSLVILITNVIDEVNAYQIYQYLDTAARRHLPVGIVLRDRQVFAAADRESPRGRELYEAAAASEILSWRHRVLTSLQHQGILTLDVFPEQMTAPLVNQYLEIKARHLL